MAAAPTETTYDITNCKCTSVKKEDGLQGMDCKCDALSEKIATKLGITGAPASASASASLASSMSRWFVAIWLMLVIVLGISVFVYLLYRAILQTM